MAKLDFTYQIAIIVQQVSNLFVAENTACLFTISLCCAQHASAVPNRQQSNKLSVIFTAANLLFPFLPSGFFEEFQLSLYLNPE